MKTVPLKEVESRPEHYRRLCQEEPIVVTVDGVPQFQIVPLDEDDTFISDLIETNAEFRQLLEERKKDKTISAEEMLRRLEED
jgi:antitoxin (DNA-binding transcriptional repressor) of toxin-antitoxin stability system